MQSQVPSGQVLGPPATHSPAAPACHLPTHHPDFSLSKPVFNFRRGHYRPPQVVSAPFSSLPRPPPHCNPVPPKAYMQIWLPSKANHHIPVTGPLPGLCLPARLDGVTMLAGPVILSKFPLNSYMILFLPVGPRPTACLPAPVTLAIGGQGCSYHSAHGSQNYITPAPGDTKPLLNSHAYIHTET